MSVANLVICLDRHRVLADLGLAPGNGFPNA
jgi:hypothetical protein